MPALTVGESSDFDHSERLSALLPFIFGCVIAAFVFGRFGQVEYPAGVSCRRKSNGLQITDNRIQ